MNGDRDYEAPKVHDYEAPKIRDLEELGLSGQFPLGIDTCSIGTGGDNTCISGIGPAHECEVGD